MSTDVPAALPDNPTTPQPAENGAAHTDEHQAESHESTHEENVIIIKRIIKKADGHGGSWKIAYADFVTAMMAFFMLMWLLSMLNQSQLQGIAKYFRRPLHDIFIDDRLHNTNIPKVANKELAKSDMAANKEKSVRDMHDYAPVAPSTASPQGEPSQSDPTKVDSMNRIKSKDPTKQNKDSPPQEQSSASKEQEQIMFAQLKEQIEKDLKANSSLNPYQNQVDIKVTPDGLRINLKSLQGHPMFSLGKTDFERYAVDIINWLAIELKQTMNKIAIVGHTDDQPYLNKGDYSNWELSADRANAVRRYLIKNGLKQNRILRVQGAGSVNLQYKKDGANPINRRIEIILLSQEAAARFMNQ